jgi:hypothetical protein
MRPHSGIRWIIAGKDPDRPQAQFSDHAELHIERRPPNSKLTPASVLGYLVEKGLFRIGAESLCPECNLASWLPIDLLKQRIICELCGHEHDATRQMVDAEWSFRRSGVLGAERNAQGAIPVVLTLQQIDTTLRGSPGRNVYSPSLDLVPLDAAKGKKCEIDLVWLNAKPHHQSARSLILLGECKDQWSVDSGAIEHLRSVADALPAHRFDVFILLAKLCPFTPEEISLAKTLNDGGRNRVIMLTDRELEPYMIFERTRKEFGITERGHQAKDLALVTSQIYFSDPVVVSGAQNGPGLK